MVRVIASNGKQLEKILLVQGNLESLGLDTAAEVTSKANNPPLQTSITLCRQVAPWYQIAIESTLAYHI